MFTKTKQSKQKHGYCHKMLAALLTVVLIFVMLPSVSAAELSGYGDTSVVNIINNGSGKYLNVGLGYDTNGNNIYQYTNDSSVEQKFRLKYYSANQCYFINAMCSSDGYNRGLSAVSTSSTSNVQLYSVSTGSQLQQWVFTYVGNGLYTISPYANRSLYLTAHNGSNGSRSRTATSGSNASGNVYVTTMNGTDEFGDPTYGQYQLWRIDSLIHARRAEQGYYRIKNVKSDKYLSRDASGNISQQPESSDYMQTWYLYDMGGNHIVYAADNLWFGLAMFSGTNGASFSYDDSIGNYLNVIRNYGESTYRIATDYSYYGYVATVRLGSTEAGATIVQTTYTGADSQKWELEPFNVESGNMYMENNANGKLTSVEFDEVSQDFLASDGAISLQSPNGNYNQRWSIVSNGDTSVRIVSQESGMCLSILEDTPSATATIVQQSYTGRSSQKWDVYKVFDYWIIKSPNSKYVLSRSNDSLTLLYAPFYGSIDVSAQWEFIDPARTQHISAVSPPAYVTTGLCQDYYSSDFFANVTAFADNIDYTFDTYVGTVDMHVLTEMMTSEIFSILTHGTATSLNLSATEELTVSEIASLNTMSSKLCVFLSCNSGASVSSGNNIVQQAYSEGADCVIGWNTEISADEALIWGYSFYGSIAEGETIEDALVFANENAGITTMNTTNCVVLGNTAQTFGVN